MPEHIPTLSLKAAPFQFAEFKPIQYTPKEIDRTILDRSLQQIDVRDKQARNMLDAYVKDTNAIRSELNSEEWDDYDAQVAAAYDRIKTQIDLGNTNTAFLMASDLGREFAKDTEIQNKIATQKSFKEFQQKIRSMGLDEYTIRMSEDLNKYRYTGKDEYIPQFTPVKAMSMADAYATAVGRAVTQQDSRSFSNTGNSNTFTDANGNIVTDDNGNPVTNPYSDNKGTQVRDNIAGVYSGTNFHNSSTRSFNEKRKEDINNIFRDLLKDYNVRASLKQHFRVMHWLYNHATEVLNNPNATEAEREQAMSDLNQAKASICDKNGILYPNDDNENGFNKWVDDTSASYFEHSSWRHETKSDTISNTTAYSESTIAAAHAKRAAELEGQLAPGGVNGNATVDSYSVTDEAAANVGTYNAYGIGSLLITPNVTTSYPQPGPKFNAQGQLVGQ